MWNKVHLKLEKNRNDVTYANRQLLGPLGIHSPCSRKYSVMSPKSSRVLVSTKVACLLLHNQTLPPCNFKPEWGDPKIELIPSEDIMKALCPSAPDAQSHPCSGLREGVGVRRALRAYSGGGKEGGHMPWVPTLSRSAGCGLLGCEGEKVWMLTFLPSTAMTAF